jgi:hypothetical protein
MIRIVKIILLVGCIGLFSITAGVCAPGRQDSSEAIIREAIKSVDDLKVGETRAEVERSFELDGGRQSRKTSRYLFKKCNYIKIDVEFSIKGDANPWVFSPADVIVHISRPYLESPLIN